MKRANNPMFDENVEQLRKGVLGASANVYSDFYQGNKYEFTDYVSFSGLPLLKKEDIISVPLEKRTFIPEDDIITYGWTSGTTGSGKPLVVPRAVVPEDKYLSSRINDLGIKKTLLLFKPAFTYYKRLKRNGCDITSVLGDINNMENTALISKEAGIDAIETSPTALYRFVTELEKIGFDMKRIKWISIGGEYTSKSRKRYFENKFPNASIETRYGNSESGGNLAYQCQEISSQGPDCLHPNENFLFEILDQDNKPVGFGESGKIVVTHLGKETTAFPVIRYVTGDYGIITQTKCKCGNGYQLKLLGRSGYSELRYAGLTFHTEAIEYALSQLSGKHTKKYELHVVESLKENKIKTSLVLLVDPEIVNNEALPQIFKENYYLSAEHNLDYFLKQGEISSFTISGLDIKHLDPLKRKIILTETS